MAQARRQRKVTTKKAAEAEVEQGNLVEETPTEVPSEKRVNLVEVGETSQNTTNSLVGKVVSLNTKVQTFFGIGPIWLTPETYKVTVPDTLSPEDYRILERYVNNGALLVGDIQVDPVDKDPSVLTKYTTLTGQLVIGLKSVNKEATTAFRQLVGRRQEGGYTALEIIDYCDKWARENGLKDAAFSVLRTMRKAAAVTSEETLGINRTNKEGIRSMSLEDAEVV